MTMRGDGPAKPVAAHCFLESFHSEKRTYRIMNTVG